MRVDRQPITATQRVMIWVALPLLLGIASVGGRAGTAEHAVAADLTGGTATPTQVAVQLRNVDFRFDPKLILGISRLDGALLPAGPKKVPTFDDKTSFVIAIGTAEVSLGMNSLDRLLNGYVFAEAGAGLQSIQVSIADGRIKLKATMNKGLHIPIEITGVLSITNNGTIRIHPTQIHAAHLPLQGAMGLFGLHVGNFTDQSKTRGLEIDKNDLILDPQVALPPPRIRAKAQSVRIQGDKLVLRLGTNRQGDSGAPPSRPPGDTARGYMRFRGGALRFGDLTMRPADLAIVNLEAHGPFDFFLDRYQQQLLAGFAKATPGYRWVVYMPGYERLKHN